MDLAIIHGQELVSGLALVKCRLFRAVKILFSREGDEPQRLRDNQSRFASGCNN